MALSPQERDAAQATASVGLDRFLQAIANVDQAGYYVGLLINGMTVYGQVASDRAIAEVLDGENARIGARLTEQPAVWTEVVEGGWTRRIDQEEEEHNGLVERNLKAELDEMSDDDARMTIRGRAVTLTLIEAKVVPAGAPTFDVPVLRVLLAQVGGWWLVPRDEEGTVSFTHPG